jgi:bifunctional UDP-N-acetylglucosamine pyrophosphorylase/glucosamine-1-phosphate N-acetyltransferase
MKLNIVILAAGEGKRMYSSLPKVLHQVGGVSMLEHVINAARSLNPEVIHVVHGNGGDRVKNTLKHLRVRWIRQKQQLGTGHAVLQAIPHIADNSRVLILYGDVPLISKELLQTLVKGTPNDQFGLIVANLDDPSGFGRIIRDQNDNVIAIVEQKDANEKQLKISEINTGILLAPAKQLKGYLTKLSNHNKQGEYYLTDVIDIAVADGCRVKGVTATKPEEIFGANDKYQLALLEGYYQQQKAKQLMLQGLTLVDPKRFDIRGKLEFGKDVVIDVNVVIKGKVKLGNNVQILPNCVIEDAVIEDNCIIGPFARIRPGTRVKCNAHIGNFVELKNTEFGMNSKANHLTYLGDATVGKDVNIGAGTITCNYDGVNKYRTVIDDNAFIGSDTMLVAPVKVGKNSTIGAGSTITENTPANQLTIARNKQVTIKGWQRPKKKSRKK